MNKIMYKVVSLVLADEGADSPPIGTQRLTTIKQEKCFTFFKYLSKAHTLCSKDFILSGDKPNYEKLDVLYSYFEEVFFSEEKYSGPKIEKELFERSMHLSSPIYFTGEHTLKKLIPILKKCINPGTNFKLNASSHIKDTMPLQKQVKKVVTQLIAGAKQPVYRIYLSDLKEKVQESLLVHNILHINPELCFFRISTDRIRTALESCEIKFTQGDKGIGRKSSVLIFNNPKYDMAMKTQELLARVIGGSQLN